jgi:filamentous hemagglutinin family protein
VIGQCRRSTPLTRLSSLPRCPRLTRGTSPAPPQFPHANPTLALSAGDAAVFTTTTPSLNIVISRVTGTSATTITGLLALNPAAGSAPNFFFVNPNGVTFGAGAQVDVPGAFHVGAANSLNFADRTAFKAGNGPDSTLTIAAPESFGFLGNRPVASVNFNNLDRPGPSASEESDANRPSLKRWIVSKPAIIRSS